MNEAVTKAYATVEAELDRRRADLEALVFEMVAINSQIPPFGDERAICDFLSAELGRLGLPEAETHALVPERPNLLVRIPGTPGGKRLLLCGHIDTKPVGDARSVWRSEPLTATIIGDRVYGLGTSDMKASVGAMITAVAAIRACGIDLAGDVLLALVADEEAGATFGAKFLAPRIATDVDAALIGEPSGWTRDWEGIHLVSRGLCCFKVRVHGTQMHSSLSDRMPSVNANVEMARLILQLRDEFAAAPIAQPRDGLRPTANIAVTAGGGVFYGVVPGESAFGCDLRIVPGMSEGEVRAFLDDWAQRMNGAGPAQVSVEYDDVLSWIPSASLAADHPLAASAVAATRTVLGAEVPLSSFPGTTDAPWFERAGVPTLPSLGPGILTYAHGPNEFVSREAIHEAAKIYAHIVLSYCGVER
ncbi:M20 family metallopeptidase [Dactylosporangium sucinum]|uniref:Succinyl-diaminopimelate desuccinylase n=1 Tax=Dactylosporangium sucinum TaxID=1424081 RepID=A0A917SZR5_9ACTN|nr:M20/M25/M40 family metallo-hydrolase [Dactylosporangium sucinum]GGM04003.1 succinyl-diaminopimelate desuccinylase [Dactylosporangium sucinum]